MRGALQFSVRLSATLFLVTLVIWIFSDMYLFYWSYGSRNFVTSFGLETGFLIVSRTSRGLPNPHATLGFDEPWIETEAQNLRLRQLSLGVAITHNFLVPGRDIQILDAGGVHPRSWTLFVPLWIVALASLPLSIYGFALRYRARSRQSNGHCVDCRYDLRATPGRCPECGKTVEEAI
jgi:hypothetical protein